VDGVPGAHLGVPVPRQHAGACALHQLRLAVDRHGDLLHNSFLDDDHLQYKNHIRNDLFSQQTQCTQT